MLSTGTTPRQAGWGQLTGFLPWLVSPQWLPGLLPLSCCWWWCTCGWGGNLVAAFISCIFWTLSVSSIFVWVLVIWFRSCFSWIIQLFSISAQGASKFTCLVLFMVVPVFYFQVPQSPHVWCWHQVSLCFLLSAAGGLHVSNKFKTSNIFTALSFFPDLYTSLLSLSKMFSLR